MITHHDKQHQLEGDLPTGTALNWMDSALCAQVDGDLHYPDKGASNKEAKRICGLCPVKAQCLEYAMERDERFGVYGGLTERERHKLKASRLDYTHHCGCGERFRTSIQLAGHRSSCGRKDAA